MKRLLFSLLFLLPFSSCVDAGPWTQMIKGGLKGGLKNNQSTNNKKRKFESFTYKVTDQDTYEASISLEYDSFTGETKCKYPQILLPMIQIGLLPKCLLRVQNFPSALLVKQKNIKK